jgi:hypothetical protein
LESLSTPGGWPANATKSASQQGTWVPATDLAAELGTTRRTLARWLLDERLAFPRPHCVNHRLYFERGAVEAWKAATAVKAAGGAMTRDLAHENPPGRWGRGRAR